MSEYVAYCKLKVKIPYNNLIIKNDNIDYTSVIPIMKLIVLTNSNYHRDKIKIFNKGDFLYFSLAIAGQIVKFRKNLEPHVIEISSISIEQYKDTSFIIFDIIVPADLLSFIKSEIYYSCRIANIAFSNV